ncbi:PEP-CTERM sorting domain-containing protein [Tychonema sp. LEGE 07203]|uniref:PEP-CTERM sorting domain-containing protein n=1 Tax=Tychonema sp. LEGE 07203 TaxID=1828671 RepID=UPI00187FCC57|nr:PEP-CTERM sorting domain-containing protein [Tychonema sp. LEGE 07203]MBE9092652.1 PEP-CTERM sorting domain-containing protein [Tychonema sp. LEGE 07203]
MNTKILSALTATAAVTAMLGAAAPAHAFSFGTNGITFTQDQDVEFNFKESHGAYTSSLGIYQVQNSVASLVSTLFSETKSSDNGSKNEWRGTSGNTVASGKVVFTFLANQVYTLGLSNLYYGNSAGTVYSTSALNGGSQQAVFGDSQLWNALGKETTNTFQAAGNFTNGIGSLFNGGTTISFDDRGNRNDADFQDFTVTAEAVPEPMTMTGLALGLGGLIAARRRRASKTAS